MQTYLKVNNQEFDIKLALQIDFLHDNKLYETTLDNLLIRQYCEANGIKNNELEYSKYELVYWTKVFSPLTILAMVLLAVPFVFGSVRHVTIGKQILIGFLTGLSFYILSRLIGQVGLVYGVPAALSALLPTLLIITLMVWSYRRIR